MITTLNDVTYDDFHLTLSMSVTYVGEVPTLWDVFDFIRRHVDVRIYNLRVVQHGRTVIVKFTTIKGGDDGM